jgi:hypothetical protein
MPTPSRARIRRYSWVNAVASFFSATLICVASVWAIAHGTVTDLILGIFGLAVGIYFVSSSWRTIRKNKPIPDDREDRTRGPKADC